MRFTGINATKEEVESLRLMMRTPVMYVTGGLMLGSDPIKECHRLAIEHGLPEISGYYGIAKDGEFVET